MIDYVQSQNVYLNDNFMIEDNEFNVFGDFMQASDLCLQKSHTLMYPPTSTF